MYMQCCCFPFVFKINVLLNVTICRLFVGVFSSNDLYLYQARDAATKKIIEDHGPHAYLIPSSDHPHIIAGQGSIGVEFLEQVASFFIYLYTLLVLNFTLHRFRYLSNSLLSSSLPTYSSRCLLAKSKTCTLGGASLKEREMYFKIFF